MAVFFDIKATIKSLIEGRATKWQQAEAAHLLIHAMSLEGWEDIEGMYTRLRSAGVLKGFESCTEESENA